MIALNTSERLRGFKVLELVLGLGQTTMKGDEKLRQSSIFSDFTGFKGNSSPYL